MHININFTQFHNEFRIMGRDSQFSYEGLISLFDYLEDSNIELDVIAIFCEYSENTLEELSEIYSIDGDILSYLQNNTNIVGVTSKGNIIYSNF